MVFGVDGCSVSLAHVRMTVQTLKTMGQNIPTMYFFSFQVMLPMSGQVFDDPSSKWFTLQDRVRDAAKTYFLLMAMDTKANPPPRA